MRQYRRRQEQAKRKAQNRLRRALEAQLPMDELMAGFKDEVEGFALQLGLLIMQRVMEEEIQQKVGRWGRQPVRRHGHQPGYVVFAGRKVSLARPRLRSREEQEVPLASYASFQQNGRLQQAVGR